MIKYTKLSGIFLFFIILSNTYGQNNTLQKEYYKWYDQQTGIKNSGLFNGIRYTDKFRNQENNHIFFKELQFKKGDLTYDGQAYFDIPMKYDLYDDHLIVDLKNLKGSNIIRLLNEKVENFILYNTRFVRISDKNSSSKESGFYESIYKSPEIASYKKYKKTAKKHLQTGRVSYSFKEETNYFIYFKNTLYPVASRGDMISIFPKYKNEIKAFYKNNKQLISADYHSFLKLFTKKMSEKISNSTQ